ncbi:hypothetical protein D3C76_662730 [compost metagenome]
MSNNGNKGGEELSDTFSKSAESVIFNQQKFAEEMIRPIKRLQESIPPAFRVSLDPEIVKIAKQFAVISKTYQKQVTSQMEKHIDFINSISDDFKKFSNLNIAVPKEVLTAFKSFNSYIDESTQNEDHSDMECFINVRATPTETSTPITWITIISFLIAFWGAIYPVYSDIQDGIEQKEIRQIEEMRHDELMQKYDELIRAIERNKPIDTDQETTNNDQHDSEPV